MREDNFSIILPTFCEVENIPQMIKRIANINFGERKFETIIVDDNSQDGTEEVVRKLEKQYAWLKLIIRREKKGLSASVIEGLYQAQYPIGVIMDADLSHPPEKIKEFLKVLAEPNVDLVIGSRYIAGGSCDEHWPLMRRMASKIAIFFARKLISLPLSDPLSGFLAFRKDMYLVTRPLIPKSWKIGLEIMVKCHCHGIREIPIHFSRRMQGHSKFTFKTAYHYMKHLMTLTYFSIKMKQRGQHGIHEKI